VLNKSTFSTEQQSGANKLTKNIYQHRFGNTVLEEEEKLIDLEREG
jgi:hypothetical protein